MPPPATARPGQPIGPPGQPPAPFPGWQPAPPPKQKSYTGVVVASVVIGMLLFGVGTVGIVLGGEESNAASDHDATSYDSSTFEPSNTDTTDPGTSSSSESSTESSTETSGTDSGPAPVTTLANHPIFQPDTGAMDTPCTLPSFATDLASQDAFYQAAVSCLIKAWTPALEAANLPVKTPNVITTGQDINSPCGTRSWNATAMYCSGNHTIYMTARYYSETEGQVEAGVYLGQFAHEFGHAIQGMSGLMTAYGNALYDAGGITTPKGLELSRRAELQATCFEGEALAGLQRGGLSNDYVFTAIEDSAQRGDEGAPQPDHGSTEANRTWVEQGFYENRTGQCNTWSAPTGAVD